MATLNGVLVIIQRSLRGLIRSFTADPARDGDERVNRVEQIRHNFHRVSHLVDHDRATNIQQLLGEVDSLVGADNGLERENARRGPLPRHVRVGSRGNTRCNINRERLEHLLSIGYSVSAIAQNGLLGGTCHPNTLHNFIRVNGITAPRQRFSAISDNELSAVISNISRTFPNSGVQEVTALLRTSTPPLLVQRDRVARIMAARDPVGTARRWSQVIPRRTYSVPSPNSLWHVDTNHKLIRWNFVVDGAIDGYSRLVVYLRVHTDNLAASAWNDFMTGIREYGIPSRVRADGGSEFVHIRRFMNFINGENRGSFMSGPSVHNQRIERLWRDVVVKVLVRYRQIFYYLEEMGLLNLENNVHISVLHHVFGTRLHSDLERWRVAHNNHRIRTENQHTPLQLWYRGSLLNSEDNSTAMRNLFSINTAAVDEAINRFHMQDIIEEPTDIGYVLPRTPLPLSQEQLEALYHQIDEQRESNSDGIDIYAEVLRYVASCVV